MVKLVKNTTFASQKCHKWHFCDLNITVMNIERPLYLDRLIKSKHNGLVKVITGIRRCGKSYLLFELFHRHLIDSGVDEPHIIEVALDDRSNVSLRDPDKMLAYIKSRIIDQQQYYIVLDEVQLMGEFVDVLNSLLHIRNVDTYVTGSNSRFLSSDIVTDFRGRGEQIHLHPLSFREFCSAFDGDKRDAWREYYTYGGLPKVLALPDDVSKTEYLLDLYHTVYLQDVKERHRIKNASELEELTCVLASSIGSSTNPTKLSKTFKSVKHINIASKTITRYIDYMADAFLLERAIRYNIKGKKYINTLAKHYFVDLGLRNAILDFRQQEETHIMENIIYNELRMRGFRVDVGCIEQKTTDSNRKTIRKLLEIDFVANKGNARYYIQSAFAMPTPEKEIQEKRSLMASADSFKKIIVTGQDIKPKRDENGIVTINIIDFLIDPNSLDY